MIGVSALHAEWTKVRTVPGTIWLLLGTVALTVLLGALATNAMAPGGDPAESALTGVALGQAIVVILAVAMVSGEYATGMIHTSLIAVPKRLDMLAAKGIVVSALVLVAGTVAVLGSIVVGLLALPDLTLTGPVLRASVGSVLYLALIGLLSLGLAVVVRDAAAAIGVVLGLLYLTPIVTTLVSDPDWHDRLRRLSPMTAGLAVQSTVDVVAQPVGPWEGLGVLAGWAAAALLAGAAVLRLRDA
ncbi:ABC transporter permease subunit [Actinophytocola sp.]|uniref:ABC transporter permease subunit n=1 Tax=Actinophytocola sp. TaxID=1872138 RepID=UPI002ED4D431